MHLKKGLFFFCCCCFLDIINKILAALLQCNAVRHLYPSRTFFFLPVIVVVFVCLFRRSSFSRDQSCPKKMNIRTFTFLKHTHTFNYIYLHICIFVNICVYLYSILYIVIYENADTPSLFLYPLLRKHSPFL